jgi:H+/Cl- antiporter ClcA
MKRPLPYEIAAAILALFGAFVLVGVYMPVLNPGLTRITTHRELPSVGYYILLTPIPVSILVASWFLNRKAQAMRRGHEGPPRVPESALERRLKWVVAAVVLVLVAIAFLW